MAVLDMMAMLAQAAQIVTARVMLRPAVTETLAVVAAAMDMVAVVDAVLVLTCTARVILRPAGINAYLMAATVAALPGMVDKAH